MLCKLRKAGGSESACAWFESYLSRREQVVKIQNTVSDPLPLMVGVRQGSIRGPVLFTLCVYMLWFNFILGSIFNFFCLKLIIIHYHTQKQKERRIKPRIKLNHNIYNLFRVPKHCEPLVYVDDNTLLLWVLLQQTSGTLTSLSLQ